MPITSQGRIDGSQAVVNEDSVYRKINRRLLPLLLLCYTFAYLDRVNIGFAKLHMQEDIPALTEAVFGIGAGLFFLAYAFLEIPSNMLMHRIGARRTITRIMMLWGLSSAAMLFVRDETSFYVLRILLGIFEAGFAPGIILYLTYWYPARRMAAVMGVYMLAGPIGSILGSGVSAAIIAATDNLGGMAGWQWMFLIQGLPCVLLGYIFWKAVSDRPDQAGWLSDAEKSVVSKAVGQSSAEQGTHRFIDALREPSVYVMAVAYFGIMCGIYAVSFWLPTILKDNGVQGTFSIGLLTAIPYALTIPTMILLSRSSDRFQERKWHSIIPAFIAAGGADDRCPYFVKLPPVLRVVMHRCLRCVGCIHGFLGRTKPSFRGYCCCRGHRIHQYDRNPWRIRCADDHGFRPRSDRNHSGRSADHGRTPACLDRRPAISAYYPSP